MNAPLNLEQLRKQAKELARAARAAGRPVKLADAQGELARQHGFASWPSLKAYVERLGAEQPFHTDIEYYEGRAYGIATVNGVTTAEARRDLAQRHGFPTWGRLRRHVQALCDGRSRRRRSSSRIGPSRRTTTMSSRGSSTPIRSL